MSDTFEIVDRQELLSSYVFSVERRTIRHDGESYTRDIAVHPGAVAIVAVNHRDEVALVRQYRATIDADDDDPLATAQRELLEEVGVSAATWGVLARVYVSPGWTDQLMHIFVARDLTSLGRRPEGPEEHAAQIAWLDREAVRRLLDDGEFNDATLTIGLRHFLEDDERP